MNNPAPRFVHLASFLTLVSLTPRSAWSTTAVSLRDRVAVDGVLDEYANDEWVLDASSTFAEPADDSRWGTDAEIVRAALTWDTEFLYLAVEFRSRGEFVALYLANSAGGVGGLDGTGSFRRAIELPGLRPNLLALAAPGAAPVAARADASHPFAFVDRATLPAVVRAELDGGAGFEMAIPWSLLAVRDDLRAVWAITGEVGSGSGDAAPDARAFPDDDRLELARVDRFLRIDADVNDDGIADPGVSPRATVTVESSADATRTAGEESIGVSVDARAFVPDRSESATFTVAPASGSFEDVAGACTIYSVDGRAVRTIALALAGPAPDATAVWDGRDGVGRVVDGGVYVAAFELEFTAGGARSRARAAIGVAVVR